MEGSDRHWRGSPLDMSMGDMDPHGIRDVVVEYDNGDSDVFRPKRRGEYGSYELHQLATYMDTIAHDIRQGFGS